MVDRKEAVVARLFLLAFALLMAVALLQPVQASAEVHPPVLLKKRASETLSLVQRAAMHARINDLTERTLYYTRRAASASLKKVNKNKSLTLVK